MEWEERMFDLLDSLEARAQVEFAVEREAEVADRLRSEYRSVTWASRLHASVGSRVVLSVQGPGRLSGELSRVGAGWCLLQDGPRRWFLFSDAIVSATGLSPRSLPDAALGAVQRLGPGSPLRRLADDQVSVLLRMRDGDSCRGRIERIGADFVEVVAETGSEVLVPWSMLAAVQSLGED